MPWVTCGSSPLGTSPLSQAVVTYRGPQDMPLWRSFSGRGAVVDPVIAYCTPLWASRNFPQHSSLSVWLTAAPAIPLGPSAIASFGGARRTWSTQGRSLAIRLRSTAFLNQYALIS